MANTLHITVPILPGKRIEFAAPELPEAGEVELVVYLPTSDDVDIASGSKPLSRYPAALEAEYKRLIAISQSRPMTSDEQCRLEQIKDEINANDAVSPQATHPSRTLAAIANDLTAIRQALEEPPSGVTRLDLRIA